MMQRLFFVLLSSAALPLLGYTQSAELLWRVVNPAAEVVPTFADDPSPFPQKQEDLTAYDATDVTLTAEELAEREQNRRAAVLLAEVRTLIQSNQLFQAKITGLMVQGVVMAQAKTLALIDGTWLGVGDKLAVPIEGVASVFDLLAQLNQIDPELADVVRQELNTRLTTNPVMQLTVHSITANQVILADTQGQQHILNLVASGW